jgi:O-6-methylguanine DNA methyltransferase
MTDIETDLYEVVAGLEALRTPAPPSVAHGALLRTGVADGFGHADSPIGRVAVAFGLRGVSAVILARGDEEADAAELARVAARAVLPAARLPDEIVRAIAGERARVRVNLSAVGAFDASVLAATRRIARGEVRPYAWVAARIGNPRAVRAVGSALGRNPVPLIIPCHRVVRSDGSLGHYGLGDERKRTLLAAEGVEGAR